MKRSTRRLRGWAARAALSTLAAAALLLAAELLARRFHPLVEHAFVRWPSKTYLFHTADAVMPGVSGTARFRVNSLGFRGSEPPPGSRLRVLAVGGSTTECSFLDESEAWTGVVEAGLRAARPGLAPWVANAGVSGRTTRDHLVQLERLLSRPPRFDVLVLLVGCNDLLLRLAQEDAYDPGFLGAEGAREHLLGRAFELLPRSEERRHGLRARIALWRLAGLLRARLREAPARETAGAGLHYAGLRAKRAACAPKRDTLPDLGPALLEYRRNLEGLLALAERRGVGVIACTQPALWQTDPRPEDEALLWMGGIGSFEVNAYGGYHTARVLAEGLEAYNGVLRAVCAERGVECVDLAALLAPSTASFYDDVHFNEAGARRVGELLVPRVLALLDGRPPPPR